MSVQEGTPVRASASDAPKPARNVRSLKWSRGWSCAFLASLLAVEIAWMAFLVYAGFRVIGAMGVPDAG